MRGKFFLLFTRIEPAVTGSGGNFASLKLSKWTPARGTEPYTSELRRHEVVIEPPRVKTLLSGMLMTSTADDISVSFHEIYLSSVVQADEQQDGKLILRD